MAVSDNYELFKFELVQFISLSLVHGTTLSAFVHASFLHFASGSLLSVGTNLAIASHSNRALKYA